MDDRIELYPTAEMRDALSKAELLNYIADLAGELAQTASAHREMFLSYLLRIVSDEALDRARTLYREEMDIPMLDH